MIKVHKSGIIETSHENILVKSLFTGSFTLSGETFTCNPATAFMDYSKQITLNPYDIYSIDFDMRCKVYESGSGVYVGPQLPNWSGSYTCYLSEFNFTTNKWNAWGITENPYYISGYSSKSWGHVKTYVCGSKVDVNAVPIPVREGGCASYDIRCARALDGSASTHLYKDTMNFWRLGANSMTSTTIFEFANIKVKRLGNLETNKTDFSINGLDANQFMEV